MKRVNINFSDEVYAKMKALADGKGQTIADTLRDALALEIWYQQVEAQGGKILVESKDGKIREVVRV